MITYTAPMWVELIIGFIIGAAAEIWRISNPETLIRLAKWEDRLFVTCIALGFAIGTPVLFGLYAAGVGFHWGPKPFYVIGVLIGGLFFGTGLALSGYFPGSIWMALGEGRRDAVYAVFGAILGAATWTALYQTVCPYTFISIILCSIMIECRDLALNHLLAVDGSWDSFEPNGTGLTSP